MKTVVEEEEKKDAIKSERKVEFNENDQWKKIPLKLPEPAPAVAANHQENSVVISERIENLSVLVKLEEDGPAPASSSR